ncbi:uncharacterized protein LOC121918032, partial [Sceloporus undulatus]|uniref:uncharacterized protein LOC121918032 n=1 Tax=Sceloporus undulatus TaxID=8520 RepID=UPI001C4BF268
TWQELLPTLTRADADLPGLYFLGGTEPLYVVGGNTQDNVVVSFNRSHRQWGPVRSLPKCSLAGQGLAVGEVLYMASPDLGAVLEVDLGVPDCCLLPPPPFPLYYEAFFLLHFPLEDPGEEGGFRICSGTCLTPFWNPAVGDQRLLSLRLLGLDSGLRPPPLTMPGFKDRMKAIKEHFKPPKRTKPDPKGCFEASGKHIKPPTRTKPDPKGCFEAATKPFRWMLLCAKRPKDEDEKLEAESLPSLMETEEEKEAGGEGKDGEKDLGSHDPSPAEVDPNPGPALDSSPQPQVTHAETIPET